LTREDRSALLALARHTILATLGLPAPAPADRPVFARRAGAFVTVHVGGELRGCIGIPEPSQPLADVVTHCAKAASSEDPRFDRIQRSDVDALDIEISVLSPLVPLADPAEVEIGRHGIVVEQGWHRGLLLPQVAPEHGWSRTEFLRQTCRKAGAAADAWERGARVWLFEADVFSESALIAQAHRAN